MLFLCLRFSKINYSKFAKMDHTQFTKVHLKSIKSPRIQLKFEKGLKLNHLKISRNLHKFKNLENRLKLTNVRESNKLKDRKSALRQTNCSIHQKCP